MLLSTDWFLPFWSEIGIGVHDRTKTDIHEGCRAIVGRFMGGCKDYFHIDFTDQRKQETLFSFVELLGRLGAGYVRLIVEEEGYASHKDEVSTAIMSMILTRDSLLCGEGDGILALDDAIRTGVIEAVVTYDFDLDRLSKISRESDSAWDAYLNGLLVEAPDALSNFAFFAAQKLRLNSLWGRICERLSDKERTELICWYRIKAASRGIPIDPVPSYIS